MLGLKSLDIISDTLKNINEDFKINDLYEVADITDQNVYGMLSNIDSDCVFQFESGLFKTMLRKIQPHSLGDLAAITALGRPGPLQAGFPDMYAKAKNENINPPEYLHGIDNITKPTHGVYVFQEQLMLISRQVSGFDASQADSLMRKAIA